MLKDQLSSIKSLDLVAIQSSTTILRKSENPVEVVQEVAKSWPAHVGPSSFKKMTVMDIPINQVTSERILANND